MKITGSVTLPHPVEEVWDALLSPEVLVRTIPGCSRLEVVGEHSYAMTVTAGVAAIKGTYDGTCALSELVPHESLRMTLQGAGAPGTIDASVDVRFAGTPDGGTEVSYDADATVGGMVGGVGQRMLTSVSKRMAGEFFGNVRTVLDGADGRAVPGRAPSTSYADPAPGEPRRVFDAPAKAASPDDFVTGIAVGAGLVLLGVVAGRLLGRGR